MQKGCPIDVIDLLREREAEFVRIWRCEQEVRQLLGLEDFPFAPPPDLPSRRKVVKGAGRATASQNAQKGSDKNSQSGKASREIRKLAEGENAYRLVFTSNGKQECSFQTDRELVRNLLGLNAQEFALQSVETVSFKDLENWETREVIWKHSEMDAENIEDSKN